MFESLKTNPRSVILDTDIGPDCDDVGALAVLISYARQTGAPILGVCNCTSNLYGSAAIDVIRSHCGYDEFPIGMYARPGFYGSDNPDWTKYNRHLAETYCEKYKTGTLELLPHVSFYRRLLAGAADDSVVLITIGMFNNLADFLRSPADAISPLTGLELAEQKVHCLVSMAALLPRGREFNVVCDYRASRYVFEHFPRPIYLSDARLGGSISTGFTPQRAAELPGNPLVEAYQLYTAGREKNVGFNASFDLTAVQFAFEGEGELYSLTAPGRLNFYNEAPDRIPEPDATEFIPEENGRIRFMVKNVPDAVIAAALQERLDQFC